MKMFTCCSCDQESSRQDGEERRQARIRALPLKNQQDKRHGADRRACLLKQSLREEGQLPNNLTATQTVSVSPQWFLTDMHATWPPGSLHASAPLPTAHPATSTLNWHCACLRHSTFSPHRPFCDVSVWLPRETLHHHWGQMTGGRLGMTPTLTNVPEHGPNGGSLSPSLVRLVASVTFLRRFSLRASHLCAPSQFSTRSSVGRVGHGGGSCPPRRRTPFLVLHFRQSRICRASLTSGR